jgi:hypothetical protein
MDFDNVTETLTDRVCRVCEAGNIIHIVMQDGMGLWEEFICNYCGSESDSIKDLELED